MKLAPTSVRGRAVLVSIVAIVMFGIVLGVGTYAVITGISSSSSNELLQTHVAEVQDELNDGTTPESVESLEVSRPVLVQITDANGAVLAASPGVPDGITLCPMPEMQSTQSVTLNLGSGPATYLQTSRRVDREGATYGVCAVLSLEQSQLLERKVLIVFALILLLIVVAVAVLVWWSIGRALHSVDDMRRQAEQLTSSDGMLDVQPTGDEVQALGDTLNDMLGRLHAQSRGMRQFIADAGHELRNPLATLRVTLEFGDESNRAALIEVDRLEALVADLLLLAKSDAAETRDFTTVHVDEILRNAIEGLRVRRDDVNLKEEIAPGTVYGDPRALRSAFDNLISNAIRHAGHEVVVTGLNRNNAYLVVVTDDGAGLTPDDCSIVFERFVRLDEARNRDEGGSGLGLAIVAAIAHAHHGKVTAFPGPGGHFAFEVPK